jgi:hypothetical protein
MGRPATRGMGREMASVDEIRRAIETRDTDELGLVIEALKVAVIGLNEIAVSADFDDNRDVYEKARCVLSKVRNTFRPQTSA